MKVIIKNKTYTCYDVYETKAEAFKVAKNISNNTKVFKTDSGKYALFIITEDVTHKY